MAHTADGIIIENVLNGCPDDFERLVIRYNREIKRIVGSMVRNRQDEQDILQDIWLSAYQRLSSLRDRDRFPPVAPCYRSQPVPRPRG